MVISAKLISGSLLRVFQSQPSPEAWFWGAQEQSRASAAGNGPHPASGGRKRLPGRAAGRSQLRSTPSPWTLPSAECSPAWAVVQPCPAWPYWASPRKWADLLDWPAQPRPCGPSCVSQGCAWPCSPHWVWSWPHSSQHLRLRELLSLKVCKLKIYTHLSSTCAKQHSQIFAVFQRLHFRHV